MDSKEKNVYILVHLSFKQYDVCSYDNFWCIGDLLACVC